MKKKVRKNKKTNKGNQKFFNLVRNFRKLGAKEFFKRWGKGIEGITAMQIAKGNLVGIVPVLIGEIIGIVVVIINKMWWLLSILIGGLILSVFQTLGYLQKYIRLKVQDKIMKMAANPIKQEGIPE